MMPSALAVKCLTKSYGKFCAVRDASFDIKPGEFTAFLGPNGAGKTTTLHSITGLCNFQSGSINVFGYDVKREYCNTRPLIGLCPQEFNFDPFLTIEQVLVYQAGYFGIPKSQAIGRTRELLTRFRLIEKRNVDFRKLSGGMKRRLLICRALIHDPKILILDEPTAGADLELRNHIWEYLKEINRNGKTIFLTTHYMEEAERLCKRIIILHRGRIIHDAPNTSAERNENLETMFLRLTEEAEKESGEL